MNPSARLEQDGADRRVIKSGGGCLSIFGLPFFGAGLFSLSIGLGFIKPQNANEIELVARLIIALMGVVFTAVGGALVFGRTRIVIDRTRSLYEKEWRLLWFPVKTETHTLREAKAITVSFSEGDSDTATTHPVRIEGPTPLALASPTSLKEATALAEEMARFLHLPLDDKINTSKSRDLGEPVLVDAVPMTPDPSFKSRITKTPEGLQITVPQSPAILWVVWGAFGLFFVMPELFSFVLRSLKKGTVGEPPFMLIITGGALLFSYLMIQGKTGKDKSILGSTTLVVAHGKITTRLFAGRRKGQKTYSVEDIVSIDVLEAPQEDRKNIYPAANAFSPDAQKSLGNKLQKKMAEQARLRARLALRTRDEVIPVLYGLSHKEALYLKALIERTFRS